MKSHENIKCHFFYIKVNFNYVVEHHRLAVYHYVHYEKLHLEPL